MRSNSLCLSIGLVNKEGMIDRIRTATITLYAMIVSLLFKTGKRVFLLADSQRVLTNSSNNFAILKIGAAAAVLPTLERVSLFVYFWNSSFGGGGGALS